MYIIFFTTLLSYMLFFALIVGPSINNTLDDKGRTDLLRKIFPKNFKFGLLICILAMGTCFIKNELNIAIFFSIIAFLFLINLYLLVPYINNASDKLKSGKKKYSAIFKKLHFLSVLLYLIKMMIALLGIFLFT